MSNKEEFENYCQQFIEHAIKYTYKETNQIETERKAYEHGIISKDNFLKLKNARENTILSFNNLAYCFKSFCNKINKDQPIENMYNLVKSMVEICETKISKM